MRRADVIARISARREDLTTQFGVRSLALFGSVARDEARPDSDVDVLVEFEGPTTFDAHVDLRVFLEDLLGCRVDVVTAKGLKPTLGCARSSTRTWCVSPDPLLYVANMVAAGEAILRYTEGVAFDAFASNDERRSAVECQVFIIGEAAARCQRNGNYSDLKCRGVRSLGCALSLRTAIG